MRYLLILWMAVTVTAQPWRAFVVVDRATSATTAPTPEIWVSADYGSYNASGSLATDTQTVATWVNRGTYGNFVNATDASRFVYGSVTRKTPNNKPCLYCYGGTRGYVGTVPVSTKSDWTLICAIKPDNAASDQNLASNNGSTYGWDVIVSNGALKMRTTRNGLGFERTLLYSASLDLNWHVVCFQKRGLNIGYWIDGVFQHSASGSYNYTIPEANMPLNLLSDKTPPGTYGSSYVRVAELQLWTSAISYAFIKSICERMALDYGITMTGDSTYPSKIALFHVGDSITETPYGNSCYPSQHATVIGRSAYDWGNLGRSGEKLGTPAIVPSVASRFAAEVAAYAKARDIVVCWAGSNDIKLGDTATDVQNRFIAYSSAVHAAGLRICILNIMRRTDFDSGKETYRQAFNSWLDLNWAIYADGYLNIAADARMDVYQTPANFVDGVHPNATGHAVTAAILAPVITAMGQ